MLAVLGSLLLPGKAAGEEPDEPVVNSCRQTACSAPKPLTPKEYLYAHAGDQAKILDRVITCESGWKPTIKNKSSSATGLAQFIDGTWRSTRIKMGLEPTLESRLDSYQHIDATIFLWDEGRGAGHWAESRPCWKPL